MVSEDAQHLQSTVISIADGSHPYVQLTRPALDIPTTLSCSTCSPHRARTLSTRDGKILALTDSHVHVFAAGGEEGSHFGWTQSLGLDAACSPLYLQELSGSPDSFLVACSTATSFGYQVIYGSEELFQIHALILPDSDITDLIFGSFSPFLQPNTDAFIYIRNGELIFGTLFDGTAPLPISIDYDTNCRPNSVVNVYPLPKPVHGKFRFILDCIDQESDAVLRYKATLALDDPSYPESAHKLPQALATGTPISSTDSEYFVIVQETSIVAVKTEDTGTYRVHAFPYTLHDVSFTDSVVPTVAIASPGQNHVLLLLENFISDHSSGLIEFADTPAFCPNQSLCLPHNMAAPTESNHLLFIFTATSREESAVGYFHLNVFDIRTPGSPLVRIENLALLPVIAFPRALSRLILPTSSSASVATYHPTLAPSRTYTSSVHVSTSLSIPANYHQTSSFPATVYSQSVEAYLGSSTRSAAHDSSSLQFPPIASMASRSSSNAVKPTQTPHSNNERKSTSLDLTSTIALTIILFTVLLVALSVLVGLLLFTVIRKKTKRPTHYSYSDTDEEKSVPMSPAQDQKESHTARTSISVNAIGVAETPLQRSNSDHEQLVVPVTLDLRAGSADTQSDNTSGVSSGSSTPSTCSGGELATDLSLRQN